MSKRWLPAAVLAVTVFGGGCRQGVGGIGGAVTLEAAHDNVVQTSKRAIKLLNGVKDEASARAAAAPLRQTAADLAAAMKQLKQTVAAMEMAGQKKQVSQFLDQQAPIDDPRGENLPDAIERVALGPHGATLRTEINALLDALLEGASIRAREGLQRWIQEKNLRR